MDMAKIKAMTDQQVKEEILRLLKEVNRPGMDKLIAFLNKSDYFTAPASTRFHNNFEGGLARHSLNVYFRLTQLIAAFASQGDILDTLGHESNLKDSIIIIALLHDICKTGFYTTEMRNRKDEQGNWVKVPVYTISDTLPFGHGEKSVYMISSFIKLTREEAMAIRWHMGYSDSDFKGGGHSVSTAFDMFPLAVLAYMADMAATHFDESKAE